MTADNGYIKCRFDGPEETLAAFRALAERADRQNRFSHGLSWLDELDCDDEAESESVSYDTIDATREFLSHAAAALPELTFEGVLEHSWPVLPSRRTIVEFSGQGGLLRWEERQEKESADDLFPLPEWDEEEEEEPEIPLTPW